MIRVHKLRFHHPGSEFCLRLDELRVGEGRSIAVTGPSGSGKTTLLHLIAGLLPVQEGSVQADGQELRGLGESARRAYRRARVGMIFQNGRLVDYLSVRDNILVAAHCDGFVRSLAKPAQRCAALAERLGIAHLLEKRADRISQGEAQRVAIARALLFSPPLLLADEPTASLDDAAAEQTVGLLIGTARDEGATLVIATHDPRSRDACAERFRMPERMAERLPEVGAEAVT